MWSDFIGNAAVVEQLRRLVATHRAQRTLVLAGPVGSGKTTLAYMLGLALNCLAPPAPGEFCGACASCAQAAPLAELPALLEAAIEHRADVVKGNVREAAPLALALHPALWWYPPDGDALTMSQARALIHQSQLRPDRGRTWTLIVPDLDQARWATQASLLKTLEEPPPGVAIVALARNPLALLPTVRSRALVLALAAVPAPELAAALAARGLAPAAADLAARLAQGAPGRALGLDLAAYQLARREALELLRAALAAASPGPYAASVFRLSESTRANKEKLESLSEILYSVLQDIVYLQSGFPEAVRNVDSLPELNQLAQRVRPDSLPGLVEALDRVQSAARRNAFRPLALAGWALGLAAEDVAMR
ncbi:MAG TPA: hypothetical protein VMV31_06080 [Terriglobales bacterium]|nr:hypothetical protein [Terriglobales bacterium]